MSVREYESRDTGQNRKEESGSSFLLGALIGGVVGAAAALLLAPKSGKEMRVTLSNQAGQMLDKTTDFRENIKYKSNDLVQQSSVLINKVKGKTSSQTDNADESEVTYISIQGPHEKKTDKEALKSDEIKKKLEEAQKAFDEEENKVKL